MRRFWDYERSHCSHLGQRVAFAGATRHATLPTQVHFKSEITGGAVAAGIEVVPALIQTRAANGDLYGGSQALRNEMCPFITISLKWLPPRRAKSTKSAEDWKISPAVNFIGPLTKLAALMLQIESTKVNAPGVGEFILFWLTCWPFTIIEGRNNSAHLGWSNMQKFVLIVFCLRERASSTTYILRQPDREGAFTNWTFFEWESEVEENFSIDAALKDCSANGNPPQRCVFSPDPPSLPQSLGGDGEITVCKYNHFLLAPKRRKSTAAAALLDYRCELWMQIITKARGRPRWIKSLYANCNYNAAKRQIFFHVICVHVIKLSIYFLVERKIK